MMNRATLVPFTLILTLSLAVAAPAAARQTGQPGACARAAAVLQFAAQADPAQASRLDAELSDLGATLAADPAARETFRTLRLRVPPAFRPALDPAIDRMVEALAGKTDPMEARRVAGEAFPDRGDAPFDPANAQALRGWLVGMNWLPAADEARGLDAFVKGMQKSGTFLFEDDACYAAGHVHDGCVCSYSKVADWSAPVLESGAPYVANREARLFGSFKKAFLPSEFRLAYLLQVKPGNTAAHHPAYPDAADFKFRNYSFGFTLKGTLQEAGLYTRWLDSGAWQNEEQELTGATLTMAAREKGYWEKYFGKDGARAARFHFTAKPACPECGSLEKETVDCVVPGEEPCFCADCGYAFE